MSVWVGAGTTTHSIPEASGVSPFPHATPPPKKKKKKKKRALCYGCYVFRHPIT